MRNSNTIKHGAAALIGGLIVALLFALLGGSSSTESADEDIDTTPVAEESAIADTESSAPAQTQGSARRSSGNTGSAPASSGGQAQASGGGGEVTVVTVPVPAPAPPAPEPEAPAAAPENQAPVVDDVSITRHGNKVKVQGSVYDPDDDDLHFTVDWGDGTVLTYTPTYDSYFGQWIVNVNHNYGVDKVTDSPTVVVTLYDEHGASSSKSRTVYF